MYTCADCTRGAACSCGWKTTHGCSGDAAFVSERLRRDFEQHLEQAVEIPAQHPAPDVEHTDQCIRLSYIWTFACEGECREFPDETLDRITGALAADF